MTEIQNNKQKNKKNGFGPCLEFGICDLKHQTPRQSHLSLIWLSEA